MSYQVVIISNRWPNEWYYLHKEFFKSLKGFQALHIQPMQWGGLSTKPKVLYAAIKDGTIKTDHIIFTDCWDMVFAKTPDEVMSHYNSFEKPIVISCERNCFPADLKDDFDKVDTISPYKYLNSGFIVGETEAILTCLEAMDLPNLYDDHYDPIKQCNVHPNDQFEWQKIWAKQPVEIALDYNQLLSQTLHDETIDTFEFNEKGIFNKITETYPCAFHFNGGAKDNLQLRKPILTHLKLA